MILISSCKSSISESIPLPSQTVIMNETIAQNQNNKELYWSNYLGRMNWFGAKSKCESYNMRLPTKLELLALYESPIQWKNQGCGGECAQWAIDGESEKTAFIVSQKNGRLSEKEKSSFSFDVRCVK
jgi:hypothetical protein